MSMGNRNNAATGAAFKIHGQAAGRTRGRGSRRPGPVTVTQLHPLADELAMFLAGGNRNRFVVISVTEVVVVNRPRKGSTR